MFSSAGKLRVKAGRTMVVLSAGRGIASFCRSIGKVRAQQGKIIAARSSVRFAGQRPPRWASGRGVRQRSLSDDLTFWILLCQDKRRSLLEHLKKRTIAKNVSGPARPRARRCKSIEKSSLPACRGLLRPL
jgi:hypothetical protein